MTDPRFFSNPHGPYREAATGARVRIILPEGKHAHGYVESAGGEKAVVVLDDGERRNVHRTNLRVENPSGQTITKHPERFPHGQTITHQAAYLVDSLRTGQTKKVARDVKITRLPHYRFKVTTSFGTYPSLHADEAIEVVAQYMRGLVLQGI